MRLKITLLGSYIISPIEAKIAQLGERMTEDHKVRCSIHLLGAFLLLYFSFVSTCLLLVSNKHRKHKMC